MINNNFSFNNKFDQKILNKKRSIKLLKKYAKVDKEIKKEINLKKTLNVLNKNFKLNFNKSDLKKFKDYKNIVIIGMGGSILGSEAIYNFLKDKIKKKIYFFDDIDEKKISDFKKKINFKNILFIIISKSGNTVETLSNSYALKILKKDARNVIIISEKKNNDLFLISKKLNIFYIEHKNYIGGRYSVLSEVGIVPALLMGIDIEKLRSRTLSFLNSKKRLFLKDSVVKLSNIAYANKYKNIVFLNYAPKLEKFLFWCQQLIAESLGKKGKGFLPTISNVPKDHHSLLQLYLDGPKDKIFYIFNIDEKSTNKIKSIKLTLKNAQILNNKSLNEIKNAQREALIKSLKVNNIPFREFKIKKVNEEVLGELFSYFILETVFIGKLTNVNTFDQPAVEQVKNYTKDFLS